MSHKNNADSVVRVFAVMAERVAAQESWPDVLTDYGFAPDLDTLLGVGAEEVVARAIFKEVQRQQNDTTEWESPIIADDVREDYRKEARAVLSALKQLPTAEW